MLLRHNKQIKFTLTAFAVLVFSFFHIEYMYKKDVSFALLSLFLVLYFYYLFKNENKALFLLLGYYILIPMFPRSVLDDYALLDSGTGYYTLHAITIGPLNILLIITFLHAYVCFTKVKGKVNDVQLKYFLICLAFIFVSLIVNMFFEHGIQSNPLYNSLSVVKPFIFLFIGTIFFSYKRPYILEFLIFCSMILGYRVILFGLGDILIFDNLRLDYALCPFLTLSVYVMLLFKGYHLKLYEHLGFFLSLFFFSRAFILITLLLIILGIFFSPNRKSASKIKIGSVIAGVMLLLPIILFNFNYRLYRFFLWKMNITKIFSSEYEMSGSGKIRISEMENVLFEISENIITFLFGKGINGIYTFDNIPQNISGVGLESFSSDQLLSGVYYSTHNFTSFYLLKMGIIGLLLYSVSIIISLKSVKKRSLFIILISVLNFLYNFWVTPILAILFFHFFPIFSKQKQL